MNSNNFFFKVMIWSQSGDFWYLVHDFECMKWAVLREDIANAQHTQLPCGLQQTNKFV